MKLIDQLEEITEEYIKAKKELDQMERDYVLRKSEMTLKGLAIYKNAESREAGLNVAMEEEMSKFLDKYWDLRGEVRALGLRREVILERLKSSRIV